MFRLYAIFFVALICAPFSPADSKWHKVESDHFEIYGELPASDLKNRARDLEAFHWLLLKVTNNQDKAEIAKVKVYLLKNLFKVGSLTSGYAGFYTLSYGEPIAISSAKGSHYNRHFTADTVLKHEYAHHFMLYYFPAAYHPWYVEGWAELVANSKMEEDNKISFGRAANYRANELTTTEWLSSNNLFVDPPWELRPRVRWRFYGQSWLMAHYLTFHPDRKLQLVEYLNAINAGDSFEDAKSVFKPGMFELDKEVKDYLRKREFQYLMFDLPKDLDFNIKVTQLSDAEETLIPLRLDAVSGLARTRERTYARKVSQKTSAFPDSSYAQKLAFNAQLEAKQFDQALGTAERLLSIDQSDSFANYAKAAAMLGQARSTGDNDIKKKDLAKSARKWIVKSNRADPESYLPLVAFFDSFTISKETIPKIATDGLIKAHQLMPIDDGLRYKLANHLETRNRLNEAKRVIMPVIWNPHNQASQSKAKQVLKKIEERLKVAASDKANLPAKTIK